MLRMLHQTNNIKQIVLNGIQAVKPDILIRKQLKYEDASSVMMVGQRSYYLNRHVAM